MAVMAVGFHFDVASFYFYCHANGDLAYDLCPGHGWGLQKAMKKVSRESHAVRFSAYHCPSLYSTSFASVQSNRAFSQASYPRIKIYNNLTEDSND